MQIGTLKKPNIHLLACGGTIASLLDQNSNEYYASPTVSIHELVSRIKSMNTIANLTCEQVLQVISHEMTFEHLKMLADKVDSILSDENIHGLVITHGTNSIEEVAYFLSLAINIQKPIVLTGAMNPADSLAFDGLQNIYNSVLIAGSREAKNIGVVLSFNDVIGSARNTTKINPSSVNAFSSDSGSALGYVQGNKVDIRQIPTYRHTFSSEFNIKNITSLPKTYIIYGYLDSDDVFVDAAIQNGAAGIISVGMGKGYQSKCLTQALGRASDQGIVVVRCSRTGKGFVSHDAKLDEEHGFIAGGSLTPQKARMLLAVALSQTSEKSKIQNYFFEY